MNRLILATNEGLVICEQDGPGWKTVLHDLSDWHVTSVAASQGVILAGTKQGVFRSRDEGQHWERAEAGLTDRHIRWLAFHPALPGRVLAGTEPANIFVSQNGGGTWRLCPEVAQLRDQFRWSLPYSPAAGCVRGFAFHGRRIYAAVEVGGVLVSDDDGETWQLAEGSDGRPALEGPPAPLVYPDVHSLEIHPSSADLVYAPTGGGFYRSNDGGRTWNMFYDCYCRAVWVDPQDAQHVILGPAEQVDRNGRIEESHDGGLTWSLASNGLDVPWPRGMVERFLQGGAELFAVLSNGQILAASLSTLEWQRILADIPRVNAATMLT